MSEQLPPTATPPSSGRSCGRCCLISLGMLVIALGLVIAAGWLGWTNFARPWVEQKQAELTHNYPWVGTALNYLVGGEIKITAKSISISEESKGSRDPSAFPRDVFVPEGAKRSAFRTERETALAVLTFAGNGVAEMALNCTKEMARRGWKSLKTADPPQGKRLLFVKSDRIVRFTVVLADKEIQLWIRVGRKD